MDGHFNSPADIIAMNMKGGEDKTALPVRKMLMMGVLAGAFIAFGGAASNTVMYAIDNAGLARLLGGIIFPVGLMMVVFMGGELFTGNCLIAMNVMAKKVSVGRLLRNLAIVYVGNLLGALLIDVLLVYSGNLDYSGGLLGAYAIKIAVAKAGIEPVKAILSGILCNILVCAAILMSSAAKDAAGKLWAIFFPICAFVVAGFEHSIANMFYIPTGILAAQNPEYAAKAAEAYGITAAQFDSLNLGGFLNNLLPVTLGNMIGGSLFVGGLFYLIYRRKEE